MKKSLKKKARKPSNNKPATVSLFDMPPPVVPPDDPPVAPVEVDLSKVPFKPRNPVTQPPSNYTTPNVPADTSEPAQPTVYDEIPDIPALVTAEKQSRIKIYPCHVNRASAMGDPCTRRLVYERTNWRDKKPYDVGLQFIFDEGNRQESAVLEDMAKSKIVVIEQQNTFEWKQYTISGHIDGRLIVGKDKPPLEIKSMSPFIFDTMHTQDDLKKYPWTKKYLAQITLYLLMAGEEKGVLLLKNKSTGQLKQLVIALDYEYGEELLQKAETINKHIQAETLPDRIDDASECVKCAFQHICLPKIDYGPEIKLIGPELGAMLDRLEVVKADNKEYIALYKTIKAYVGDRPNILTAGWRITWKESDTRAKTIPAGKMRRFKFEKLEVATP